MTNREAYVFGWVYGRICASSQSIIRKPETAAMRPYSGSAEIISSAQRIGLLKGDLDAEIGAALCEIDSIDPPMDGGSERVQPLEIQSSWQLGYFKGLSGNPLPGSEIDIKTKRIAKGMTQAQLAADLGVDQAVISRWEKGTVKPSEENLARLKKSLS